MEGIAELVDQFTNIPMKDSRLGMKVVSFPVIEPSFIIEVCQKAILALKSDQPLCAMSSPCIVVGDLHGHFFDLIRIIKKFGSPKDVKYVFLGDYIDRGAFQFETVLYLLMIKILYPHHVCLLSGNHEIAKLNASASFVNILLQLKYSPEIYAKFLSVFREMPPAGIIDGKTFCVHGGIGPETTFQGFRNLIFPIKDNNKFIAALHWSDPNLQAEGFQASGRGKGYLYGEDVLSQFLEKHCLKRLIRAHTYLENGIQEYFGGKVISVFSASNYSNSKRNFSGALFIKNENEYTVEKFEPLPVINRELTPQRVMPSPRVSLKTIRSATPTISQDKVKATAPIPTAAPRIRNGFSTMHFLSLSVPPVNSNNFRK